VGSSCKGWTAPCSNATTRGATRPPWCRCSTPCSPRRGTGKPSAAFARTAPRWTSPWSARPARCPWWSAHHAKSATTAPRPPYPHGAHRSPRRATSPSACCAKKKRAIWRRPCANCSTRASSPARFSCSAANALRYAWRRLRCRRCTFPSRRRKTSSFQPRPKCATCWR
jgi:hypothetical protein